MIKILLINGLFLLPPLLFYVTGEEETPHPPEASENIAMKRYVVENEYLPPIFGSFKYNAVLQQFDLPETVHSTTTTTTITTTDMTGSSPAVEALRTHSGFMDYERAKPQHHSKGLKSIIKANVAVAGKKTTRAKITPVVKEGGQSTKK